MTCSSMNLGVNLDIKIKLNTFEKNAFNLHLNPAESSQKIYNKSCYLYSFEICCHKLVFKPDPIATVFVTIMIINQYVVFL